MINICGSGKIYLALGVANNEKQLWIRKYLPGTGSCIYWKTAADQEIYTTPWESQIMKNSCGSGNIYLALGVANNEKQLWIMKYLPGTGSCIYWKTAADQEIYTTPWESQIMKNSCGSGNIYLALGVAYTGKQLQIRKYTPLHGNHK